MEKKRDNSGKSMEMLKNELRNAQEQAERDAKELKDVKSKEEAFKWWNNQHVWFMYTFLVFLVKCSV